MSQLQRVFPDPEVHSLCNYVYSSLGNIVLTSERVPESQTRQKQKPCQETILEHSTKMARICRRRKTGSFVVCLSEGSRLEVLHRAWLDAAASDNVVCGLCDFVLPGLKPRHSLVSTPAIEQRWRSSPSDLQAPLAGNDSASFSARIKEH